MSDEFQLCLIGFMILFVAGIVAHIAYLLLRPDCDDKDKRDM